MEREKHYSLSGLFHPWISTACHVHSLAVPSAASKSIVNPHMDGVIHSYLDATRT